MIHQYKLNGYNIVLDINSGSIHVPDPLAYEAIRLISEGKINLDILKTAHFGLDEMTEAYQYIADHRSTSMKVLIDVEK